MTGPLDPSLISRAPAGFVPPPAHLNWPSIIARAAEIVNSYDIPVTLRQLFYRLVSEELIPNDKGRFDSLSSKTADLRRVGKFPMLFDRGRGVIQSYSFDEPADRVRNLDAGYRLDRTIGQEHQVWLAVEKAGLEGLISSWFNSLSVPVVPLGGYSSQSLDHQVTGMVEDDGRPAILIYAGDFDASGMDIGRNFARHTNCWEEVIRIGLSEQQINDLALPLLQGKHKDTRAPKFIKRYPEIHARLHAQLGKSHEVENGKPYGIPVQVELDAVEPIDLKRRYQTAIDQFWDSDAYADVLSREQEDRATLRRWERLLTEQIEGEDD